jgi:Tol biopolymer transport system component
MRSRTAALIALIISTMIPAHTFAAGIPKGAIAFAAEHEGGLHYVVPPSGEVHNVAFDQRNVGDLAYSKKRGQLAFFASKSHGPRGTLYLMDVATGHSKILLTAKENRNELYRPTFDPSGDYLYAVNYSNGIFRYSFANHHWQRVKVLGRDALNPQGLSLSSSGRRAAISHGEFVGLLIAEVEGDGLRIQREVLSDFQSVTSPRWLGDDALIFAGRRKAGLQFLWKLDLNSGSLEQLTSAPIGARDFLTLAGDGKTVVFTGTRDGDPLEWRLWEVSADKTPPKQLTAGGKLSSHLFPTFID